MNAGQPLEAAPTVRDHAGRNLPAILAIDTTSEFGGIALRSEGRMVAERRMHAPDGFSQVLFAGLQELLAQAAPMNLSSVDYFAAAAGPGSFTGVRVGLAAAKGLAEAAGKAMVAVSNLRALATFGTSGRRITLIDARRGEVYAAVYDRELNCISPETVAPLWEWLDSAAGEMASLAEAEVVTLAGAPFETALRGTRWGDIPWVSAPRGLAAAVAQCAELDVLAGRTIDPLVADANYVRRSDAEILWKKA
jgi:tRNA threonylcarbamoyladenosine biosynthesis protein TsaB